jgi:hypothetical protein
MVNRKKHRKLPPKPSEPPSGYMLFYRQVMRISDVERQAKIRMKGFDQLPRRTRDRLNYARDPNVD